MLVAASIPVAAVVQPESAVIPAILGGIIVVLSSARGLFYWHENYLRFSRAREAVEGERRLYLTTSPPYENMTTRDGMLVSRVTQIEQEEMGTWLQIAAEKPVVQRS